MSQFNSSFNFVNPNPPAPMQGPVNYGNFNQQTSNQGEGMANWANRRGYSSSLAPWLMQQRQQRDAGNRTFAQAGGSRNPNAMAPWLQSRGMGQNQPRVPIPGVTSSMQPVGRPQPALSMANNPLQQLLRSLFGGV